MSAAFGLLAEKQYSSEELSRKSACKKSEQTYTPAKDTESKRSHMNFASSSSLLSIRLLISRKIQMHITHVTTNSFSKSSNSLPLLSANVRRVDTILS